MKHEEQSCNYEQALTSVDLELLLRKLERLSFILTDHRQTQSYAKSYAKSYEYTYIHKNHSNSTVEGKCSDESHCFLCTLTSCS